VRIESNRALATVLCTFCRRLLQIEARNRGNRDPTLATTEATLREKTQGIAPESLSSLNSRVSELLHFPTTGWWCGWHDDVVDIMLRMLAMTTVRNPEVFQPTFLCSLCIIMCHYVSLCIILYHYVSLCTVSLYMTKNIRNQYILMYMYINPLNIIIYHHTDTSLYIIIVHIVVS